MLERSNRPLEKLPTTGKKWRRITEERQRQYPGSKDAIFGEELLSLMGMPERLKSWGIPEARISKSKERIAADTVKEKRALEQAMQNDGELVYFMFYGHFLDQEGWDNAHEMHMVRAAHAGFSVLKKLLKETGILALPNETFIKVIKTHVETFKENKEYQEREIAKLKDNFEEQMMQAITGGKFPVDPDVLKERMELLDFAIIDPLATTLSERWGDYSSNVHLIRISNDVPLEWREHVFTHEAFHAIAGRMDFLDRASTDEDIDKEIGFNPGLSSVFSRRVGVSFNPDITERKPGMPEFHWLNEGLTEQAAMDLLGHKKRGTYPNERRLVKLLIEHGISREVLYGAYFDNYEKKQPGEPALPGTRKLFLETNKLFGKGFLFKLEGYIEQCVQEEGTAWKGNKRVIKEWERMGDGFPKHVQHQWGVANLLRPHLHSGFEAL